MPATTLGRTNAVFPDIWLSLATPAQPGPDWIDSLTSAALESGLPLEVSGNPAVWGSRLRGHDYPAVVLGNSDVENAPDTETAGNLVRAHLLQTLSALGREQVDFYFLRVRRAYEEVQLAGIFEALEDAREEGHIRFVGLLVDGPGLAALGLMQFHDAFEALIVPRNTYDDTDYRTVVPIARERRVGVITSRPLEWRDSRRFTEADIDWRLPNLTKSFYGLSLAQAAIGRLAQDHPVLVRVSTPEQVAEAAAVPTLTLPDGVDALLREAAEALRA